MFLSMLASELQFSLLMENYLIRIGDLSVPDHRIGGRGESTVLYKVTPQYTEYWPLKVVVEFHAQTSTVVGLIA